jgi:hypothetical protein
MQPHSGDWANHNMGWSTRGHAWDQLDKPVHRNKDGSWNEGFRITRLHPHTGSRRGAVTGGGHRFHVTLYGRMTKSAITWNMKVSESFGRSHSCCDCGARARVFVCTCIRVCMDRVVLQHLYTSFQQAEFCFFSVPTTFTPCRAVKSKSSWEPCRGSTCY